MSESNVPQSQQHAESTQQEDPQRAGNGGPAESGGADAAAEGTYASQAERAARLEAELEQAQSRALRAHADLENFRKRIRRDMEEERKYASLPLLRDLLPVVDNLDRALEAQAEDAAAVREGVRIVADQMASILQRHDCQRIEAQGQSFDPSLHEAIAQQPSPTSPKGTVLAVAKPGYRLHDRVIRPSQVVVSTGAASQDEERAQQ